MTRCLGTPTPIRRTQRAQVDRALQRTAFATNHQSSHDGFRFAERSPVRFHRRRQAAYRLDQRAQNDETPMPVSWPLRASVRSFFN